MQRLFGNALRLLAVLFAMGTPWAASGQGALQKWTGALEAPPIELSTLDGQRLALSDLKGKVLVVNFWATWCEPCIDEMPSMQRLQEALSGQPFEIVAVNYQEGEPRIRSFLQKVPVTFPILRDTDGGVARMWKVRIFPTSFVIDRTGSIRYSVVGAFNWSAPEAEKTLRTLLHPGRSD